MTSKTSKPKKAFSYHSYELAFCGFSGSGKTTLIESLIKKMSLRYKIGYLKHDAHKFTIDYLGKDSNRASVAGAVSIGITSSEKSAYIHHSETNNFLTKGQYIDSDFLFIEGFKYKLNQKILVLGEKKTKEKILEDFHSGKIENVLATVGHNNDAPLKNIPHFQRDDIDSLSLFIEKHFRNLANIPTFGLILAGGKSSRMKSDKGALQYHEKYQTEHIKELMSDFCDDVYVSCRENQRDLPHLRNINQIHDQYLGVGPMGGILSAFNKHPNAKWLVVAVDLPYLQKGTLQRLFKEHNPFKLASCFINPEKGWPEPLCTLYNPKAKSKFLQFLALEMSCPRKVLFNSEINALKLNGLDLENANTPEDFQKANDHFKNSEEATL